MESGSLLFNETSWDAFALSEEVLLLTLKTPVDRPIEHVRRLDQAIRSQIQNGIKEVVPAYESLAVFFDRRFLGHESLIGELSNVSVTGESVASGMLHEIPVCYELGMDWDRMRDQTGLSKDEMINLHTGRVYEVAMLGFLPGFIFLDGLPSSLHCARLADPRSNVPAGSVGIGGAQAGIYGLSTPGGWNVIGRTPIRMFQKKDDPPMHIKAGDQVRFGMIDMATFRELERVGEL